MSMRGWENLTPEEIKARRVAGGIKRSGSTKNRKQAYVVGRTDKMTPSDWAALRKYVELSAKGDRGAKRHAALATGSSPKGNGAEIRMRRILLKPEAVEYLAKVMEEATKADVMTAQEVLQEYTKIARANPNDLVEHRRTCCRFCWGKDGLYQRTKNERAKALGAFNKAKKAAKPEDADEMGVFDEAGGIGYDPRKEPNPECPECFGEGVSKPFFKDTRKLTGDAVALFAGVKQTRDGLEVRMRDQDGALLQLGRAHGIFNDKVEVTEQLTPEQRRARLAEIRDEIRTRGDRSAPSGAGE